MQRNQILINHISEKLVKPDDQISLNVNLKGVICFFKDFIIGSIHPLKVFLLVGIYDCNLNSLY